MGLRLTESQLDDVLTDYGVMEADDKARHDLISSIFRADDKAQAVGDKTYIDSEKVRLICAAFLMAPKVPKSWSETYGFIIEKCSFLTPREG